MEVVLWLNHLPSYPQGKTMLRKLEEVEFFTKPKEFTLLQEGV